MMRHGDGRLLAADEVVIRIDIDVGGMCCGIGISFGFLAFALVLGGFILLLGLLVAFFFLVGRLTTVNIVFFPCHLVFAHPEWLDLDTMLLSFVGVSSRL